jgi:hypothetical protein
MREVRELEALGDALRGASRAEADELHVRRERTRLLAAFDRRLAPPERPRSRRALFGSVAAVAVVGAVLFVVRHRTSVPEHSALPPVAAVRAADGAVWSQRTNDGREEVTLDRGSLWIHVDHAASVGGLLVMLPDGQLEDSGTTFTVEVDGGRTVRVAVAEGRIVLRLRDRPPATIDAGGSWSRDEAAPLACASGVFSAGARPLRSRDS